MKQYTDMAIKAAIFLAGAFAQTNFPLWETVTGIF